MGITSEPKDALMIGVAQLDDGRFVVCIMRNRDGLDEDPIRLGYTRTEIDVVIAALERCKTHLGN
jgi:hypothetical protein